MMLRVFALALVAGSLLSCGPNAVFSDSASVDPEGWAVENAVQFEWEVDDTLSKFDFFVDLRHDQSYPFSNIYLFAEFKFPNGKIGRDTLGCDLADERGQWFGSGFGNLVDHRIAFRSATQFPIKGTYNLTLTHAMRTDPLPGISDVGFRLESSVEH
jgi:gliding motility-associated lipoprotein GldH